MNYYQQPMQPNAPMIVRPPRPPKRYRFRWPIVYVPLLIFLTIIVIRWIATSVEVSSFRGAELPFSWNDIMRYFRIRNRERIQLLVVLGIVVTTIVVIVRILRPEKKEED